MSDREPKGVAVESPLLLIEDVRTLLEDRVAEAGARGGSYGGRKGGGAAGAAGGRQGGRQGGRFGARHLTKLAGEYRTMLLGRTEQGLEQLRAYFGEGLREEATDDSSDGSDAVQMAGCVGVGLGGLSPVVVQAVWYPAELQVTAHALEGLIKTRPYRKALDELATAVGGPQLTP